MPKHAVVEPPCPTQPTQQRQVLLPTQAVTWLQHLFFAQTVHWVSPGAGVQSSPPLELLDALDEEDEEELLDAVVEEELVVLLLLADEALLVDELDVVLPVDEALVEPVEVPPAPPLEPVVAVPPAPPLPPAPPPVPNSTLAFPHPPPKVAPEAIRPPRIMLSTPRRIFSSLPAARRRASRVCCEGTGCRSRPDGRFHA